MPKEILIANIKYLRLKKRFTFKQMAEMLGVSGYTNVQAWEYGKASPTTEHLIKLSQLFGCTIDALCRHDFNKYPIHQ